MTLLLAYTLTYGFILMTVAFGGMISERSGVINLSLEGTMVVGGLAGTLCLKYMSGSDFSICAVSIMMSVLAGILFSLLLAIASVTFNADQTLVGTALNMLAVSACTVAVKAINLKENPSDSSSVVEFVKNRLSVFIVTGKSGISIIIIVALIMLVAVAFIMNKTPFGLRLIACGEHPHAVDSVGVSVRRMRYAGVMMSGALGGIGGFACITASVSEWDFSFGVSGFGFLALAVMIFGNWRPLPIVLSAMVFGLFRALSNVYTGIPFFESLGLSSTVYNILPYVMCLVVLSIFSARSRAPKAEGIPYIKV